MGERFAELVVARPHRGSSLGQRQRRTLREHTAGSRGEYDVPERLHHHGRRRRPGGGTHIDAMRACGDQSPPLAGLVIVVKDNINLQGLTTSSGTVALKNARPRIPADRQGVPWQPSRRASSHPDSALTPGFRAAPGRARRYRRNEAVGRKRRRQRRYHDQDAVMPASHTRDTVRAIGRTVTDVVLLDAVITGSAKGAAVPLCGLRLGVPNYFWDGLRPPAG